MRALSRQKRIAIELILARHGGKPSSARPSAAGSTSSDCAGLPGEAANKLTGPAEALPDHVVVTTMWISHVAAATTWLGHHRSSPLPGGQCVSLSFAPGAVAASADIGVELG